MKKCSVKWVMIEDCEINEVSKGTEQRRVSPWYVMKSGHKTVIVVIVAGIRSVSNLGLGAAHLINNAGNDAIIRRWVTIFD